MPPTGNTLPLKVISPVIAIDFLTRFCVKLETIDVSIAIPALGPSFELLLQAHVYECYNFEVLQNQFQVILNLLFIYSNAMVTDSFITVPRFPVMVMPPLPLDTIDSMNKISPQLTSKPIQ